MARATEGISTASLKKLQSLLAQRGAATGGKIDQGVVDKLFEAELRASGARAFQRESLAESTRRFDEASTTQQSQFDITTAANQANFNASLAAQTQRDKDAASAAKVAGATDIVTALGTSYLGYKLYTGGTAVAPSITAPSAVAAPAVGSTVSSVGGASTVPALTGIETGGGLGTTAAVQAPSTVTGTAPAASGGTLPSGSIGFGIAAAVIADSAIASSTVGGFEDWIARQEQNLRSFEYGGISPGAAAKLEEAGIRSPAEILERGTGIDIYGGVRDLNEQVTKDIPVLNDINEAAQDIGTIVCTELNRQGFMSKELQINSNLYRLKFLDGATYNGYLKLATPIVKLMRKSRLFTFLVRPFGLGWALEVTHRLHPKDFIKGSLFGKFIIKLGIPLCRKVGKNG